MLEQRRALIIGAGSAIARAILENLLARDDIDQVVCVSRGEDSDAVGQHQDRLQWLESDYSEESIASVAARLEPYQGTFGRVFVCHGILHSDTVRPEKRLEDLNPDALHEVYHVNAVVPVLWLKALRPVLAGEYPCRIAVFSARIGSIDDNRRGGWYGYRASKAALNMLLKTASIEYARRAPNVRFIAFHPGTTDTPLSKPFQSSVPENKLFTPEFVAGRLLEILDARRLDEDILFLDWYGKPIAW